MPSPSRLTALVPLCLAAILSYGVLRAAEEQAERPAPPSFAEACFDDFDDSKPYPTVDEVRRLLVPVEWPDTKNALEMTTHRFRSYPRSMCELRGIFRLSERWRPDSVLRLSVLAERRLRIVFWNGQRGVSLVYLPEYYHTWLAYGVGRSEKSPLPETASLWASDTERFRRLGTATVEVRVQDGQLVLSRGPFVLLVVPFDGLPQEVFFEGTARLRGLEMTRTGPIPVPRPAVRPVVFQTSRPAEMQLAPDLPPGAMLRRLPNGRLQLDKSPEAPLVLARLLDCPRKLHEIILEIEDFTPGTGVSLLDGEGKEAARFAFQRDKLTKQVLFGLTPNYLKDVDAPEESSKRPTRAAANHQWIRLVMAGGVLNYWTSGDGVHWSWPSGSSVSASGPCRSVALFCLAGDAARTVTVRSLEIRRLERLPALASQELLDRLPPLPMVEKLDAWDEAVERLRPNDVSADAWQRACIVRSIEQNMTKTVCRTLLDRLLTAAMAEPRPVEEKIALVEESCLVADCQEWTDTSRVPDYFLMLAEQLADEGEPAVFSRLFPAMVALPHWRHVALNVFPSEPIGREFLSLSAADRWPDVAALDRQLRYYGAISRNERLAGPWGDQTEHLRRWAVDQAARRGHAARDEGQAMAAAFFREPLIESLNKETFNFLAEFKAALEAEAYDDACQLIANVQETGTSGIVPNPRDPGLLVSLPVAIELALRDTPPLRSAMEEKVGALGQLRIKQAIAEGDVDVVKAATIQFRGTRTAAEARMWLGDRALSGGAVAEAVSHYRDVLPYLSDEERPKAAARLRLAGALLGREVGHAPQAAVEIGGLELQPPEFERLVADVRRQRARAEPDVQAAATRPRVPPPGKYELKATATLDLPAKRPAGLPDTRANWYARQWATAVAGPLVVLSNQRECVAFDTATAAVRWRLPPAERAGEAAFGVAMRPVVLGKLLVARRLAASGTELVGVEIESGQLLWQQQPEGFVASDPVVVGTRLFALSSAGDGFGKTVLRLVELDPSSGRVLRDTPLLEFRDQPAWMTVAVTAVNDNLLATAAGYVICADLEGRLRWCRRQQHIRRPSDDYSKAAAWIEQSYAAPLADESFVYASQPGVFGFECLDLATGRLAWRTSLPEMIGLVARDEGRLVVETRSGFVAVDAETGKALWRHAAPSRHHGRLIGASGGMIYALAPPAEGKQPAPPVLAWLDLETGRETGRCELALSAPGNSVGTILAVGPRHWVLLARSNQSGQSDAEVAELQRR